RDPCVALVRNVQAAGNLDMPTPLRGVQNLVNRENQSVELFPFRHQLLAASDGQRVVARAPVIFRSSPLSLDPAIQQETLERGVQRALPTMENILGNDILVLRLALAELI